MREKKKNLLPWPSSEEAPKSWSCGTEWMRSGRIGDDKTRPSRDTFSTKKGAEVVDLGSRDRSGQIVQSDLNSYSGPTECYADYSLGYK
ncbi:unnamed protein product [Protopolystoma xenopodis]|uniref:Uncharacterized protein n=1 Tax=Protopolystoma xenopodis TaxID=117903 RepID=A0A448WVH4_9PLAT|nr:unnamed protein product [Protopolystoma xenopodis]